MICDIIITVKDTNVIEELAYSVNWIELFKQSFEAEGMEKEAKIMDKGGFSYKITDQNSFYTEFEICITTRTKVI